MICWLVILCVIICGPFCSTVFADSRNSETNANSVRGSSFPANDISVRVLLGSTFREEYSSAESVVTSRLSDAEIPFIHTWNISLNPSIAYISQLPIDNCTLHRHYACDDAICGSLCVNSTITQVHHKNAEKNLNTVRSYIPLSTYDLMLTFVSTALCLNRNGVHYYVAGLANTNGSYAIINNLNGYSDIINVRIMQHEISHLFGCIDNQCTDGYACIMNGKLNNTPLSVTDIWCPACKTRFDPTAH